MSIDITVTSSSIEIDEENIPFTENIQTVSKNCMDFVMYIGRLNRLYYSAVLDEKSSQKIVQELTKISEHILKQIFAHNAERLKKIILQYSRENPIRIISDISDGIWFPWELLYLGSSPKEAAIENFLGFNRNIYKIIHPQEGYPEIPSGSALGYLVQDNIHEDIKDFSEGEHNALKKHANKIGHIGRLKLTQRSDFRALFENLHIIHLAGLMIPIMYMDRSFVVVDRDFWFSIEENLSDDEGEIHLKSRPLIVMNVLDNYIRHPLHICRYAKRFLELGATGVVASNLPIPPKLAVRFTEYFYGQLFEISVDKALTKTKEHLYTMYRNPFAMFYTPYFEPFESESDESMTPEKVNSESIPKLSEEVSIKLSTDEKNGLVEELNKLSAWVDGGIPGEKGVLRRAGLPEKFINDRLSLQGQPSTDAINVITHLEQCGDLDEKHSALGLLTGHLLNVAPSGNKKRKEFFIKIIKKHQLIRDDEWQ